MSRCFTNKQKKSSQSLMFTIWADNLKYSKQNFPDSWLCNRFLFPIIILTSLDPKIPCHALMCLSCLSVWPPSTAENSTEAGGVTATLTPLLWLSWSNVSLLKKTNAETRGWPRYYVVSNMLLAQCLGSKAWIIYLLGHILTYRCHCLVFDSEQSQTMSQISDLCQTGDI